ncbi:hypothetical protein Csa_008997 [Cucumis sativus]|uniref:Uncharacterized protein n=1 Tax=Cucumis sativus TaxID=3659 RepID=A0A0A0KRQ4_CUCSA|nr:hypothetical protein Csa_008997 [Cucumis sativus]
MQNLSFLSKSKMKSVEILIQNLSRISLKYKVVNLRTTDLLFVRWHMKTQEKTRAVMYQMLQTNLSLSHQVSVFFLICS